MHYTIYSGLSWHLTVRLYHEDISVVYRESCLSRFRTPDWNLDLERWSGSRCGIGELPSV
jgi:hypothetical protein